MHRALPMTLAAAAIVSLAASGTALANQRVKVQFPWLAPQAAGQDPASQAVGQLKSRSAAPRSGVGRYDFENAWPAKVAR